MYPELRSDRSRGIISNAHRGRAVPVSGLEIYCVIDRRSEAADTDNRNNGTSLRIEALA